VQGRLSEQQSIPNPYRREILKSLQGDYGKWRVNTAAMLLESVIRHEALDVTILSTLAVLPPLNAPSPPQSQQ